MIAGKDDGDTRIGRGPFIFWVTAPSHKTICKWSAKTEMRIKIFDILFNNN
jgi:hypothetical protein